jgi:hypothetical protein
MRRVGRRLARTFVASLTALFPAGCQEVPFDTSCETAADCTLVALDDYCSACRTRAIRQSDAQRAEQEIARERVFCAQVEPCTSDEPLWPMCDNKVCTVTAR